MSHTGKANEQRIACIGAGNVGRAWAVVFARAGFKVTLFDSSEATAQAALPGIEQNLRDLETVGLIDSASSALNRVDLAPTLEEAVSEAVHVQESVREDTSVKTAVFAALADAAPGDATLASSTSAIPGSAFLQHNAARERCLVAHPVNPPSLIPLVELCPAPWTAPDTVEKVRALMLEVGQRPILLKKEIPGFLLNRLQYTLVGEAMHLIGEGYCEPEDIDAILKDGLALRWILMGPLQVAHLNAAGGFAGFVDHLGDMMRTVGEDARPDYPLDSALVEKVHSSLCEETPVDSIPRRQEERDRNLMALLRFRKTLEE